MTETHLRSITNTGTWMLILVTTYSTKIFIGQTVMTRYVIPFVISMLLARDSIVGIFIPSSISLPASLFTRSLMHHPANNSLVTLCNAPDIPASGRYSWRDLDWPHRSILVFSAHFVLTHEHPGATSWSVTHLETTPS